MKATRLIGLMWLGLACLFNGPAPAFSQGTFVYQQFLNPNPNPPPGAEPPPWDNSGITINSFPGNPYNPFLIDMDQDGAYDFYLHTDGSSLSIFGVGSGEVIAWRAIPPDLGGSSARLLAGQEIGSLATPPFEWVETYSLGQFTIGTSLNTVSTAGTIGFWGGQFGYLGVRIQKNSDWYYGWIRAGVPFDIAAQGIVYEAALDIRPNMPILAGAGVPEPSTFALWGLGIAIVARYRTQYLFRC